MVARRKPTLTPAQRVAQKQVTARNAARAAAPKPRPGAARHGQTSSAGDSAFNRSRSASSTQRQSTGNPLGFLSRGGLDPSKQGYSGNPLKPRKGR